MSYPENVVETIHCDTAKEFISTLRITDDRWLPPDAREAPWLFRGQANAEWPLIPSAWRDSIQALKIKILRKVKDKIEDAIEDDNVKQELRQKMSSNPRIEDVLRQAIFEIEAVRSFKETVDLLGFPVPQATMMRFDTHLAYDWKARMQSAVGLLTATDWKGSPEIPIWEFKDEAVVALARHHGVPVSILDWSRKPLIAAFFAADEASKDANRPEFLALWAIHNALIYDNSPRLRRPRLFRSELGYLHMQDAVLTEDVGADYHFISHGIWPDIVQAVQATPHSLEHTPLRKVTMPATETEVKELLRLLWAEGISRAHLMPTFDNIASMLQDEWMRF